MGYVADRWHKTRPGPDEPECGEHKGKVASAAHGKGKRWQARYDDPSGGERTSLWATKAEAEAEVVKQESAKQSGSWMDPKAGQVTVREFALKTWLPAQVVIDRSQHKYRRNLDRYLFPEWGDRQIRSIRPSEAAAWQQILTTKYKLSGTHPNRVAICVRSLFRLAVIDRIIPVSPFAGVKAPPIDSTEVNPPDVAEVRQLIDAAYNDRWAVMIETAALTGLRSGELRGLTVDRLDFLRRTIRVERQLVREPGKGSYLDDVKTTAGRRTVPLPGRLVTVLSEYLAEHPPRRGGKWDGLIFTMPDGEPVKDSSCCYAIKSICQKAGLRGRHWHELRHHYASVLIAGGESPKVVQKRMGHKDVTTTLRTYSHLFADADERTRDVLDMAWKVENPAVSGRIPESRGSVVEFPQVSG
jgi:integrase